MLSPFLGQSLARPTSFIRLRLFQPSKRRGCRQASSWRHDGCSENLLCVKCEETLNHFKLRCYRFYGCWGQALPWDRLIQRIMLEQPGSQRRRWRQCQKPDSRWAHSLKLNKIFAWRPALRDFNCKSLFRDRTFSCWGQLQIFWLHLKPF
jgi:hypothetical protein